MSEAPATAVHEVAAAEYDPHGTAVATGRSFAPSHLDTGRDRPAERSRGHLGPPVATWPVGSPPRLPVPPGEDARPV
ncbi:hypothetical protein ACFV3R_34100 [Streptomyces sp. NPDC059740]|uniref:hypothetical protein n=1 Tax=Streptomyces sp. NPDC059740 TaxID=3346926 RepID=UPI00365603C5